MKLFSYLDARFHLEDVSFPNLLCGHKLANGIYKTDGASIVKSHDQRSTNAWAKTFYHVWFKTDCKVETRLICIHRCLIAMITRSQEKIIYIITTGIFCTSVTFDIYAIHCVFANFKRLLANLYFVRLSDSTNDFAMFLQNKISRQMRPILSDKW